nr:hypothetical protein [Tanacetum cinerariifolium]
MFFDHPRPPDKDLNLVKTLRTSSNAVGLYLFNAEQCGKFVVGHVNSTFVCHANSTFVCHASKQLWHSRLGHHADHVLSVLNEKISLKLPSSVLFEASPYLLVYGKEPSLSHIRDVTFYEIIFPLKMKHESLSDKTVNHDYESELNLLNFFDNSNDVTPKVRSDDEREYSNGDGNVRASHDVNSSHPIDENAAFATPLNENISTSEGQHSDSTTPGFNVESLCDTNFRDEPQIVRKSDRFRNLPSKFNDYILPSNKKFGIEKHVNYFKLSGNNMCFAFNLNKSPEPKSLKEAIL